MTDIERLIAKSDEIIGWAMGLYAITLGFILIRIRHAGYDPTAAYSRSKITLSVDVRFLTDLGKAYVDAFGLDGKSRVVKTLYETSLWTCIAYSCVRFVLLMWEGFHS